MGGCLVDQTEDFFRGLSGIEEHGAYVAGCYLDGWQHVDIDYI
jgi:hypothetical protein